MKRNIFLLILVMMTQGSSQSTDQTSDAFFSLVLGRVSILKKGTSDWVRAKINQPIEYEDQIRCEKRSRCEIKLGPNKIIRLGEESKILVKNDLLAPEVNVDAGKVWLNIVLSGESLALRTPTSVASIRGTIYRADADANASHYKVYEGQVGVTAVGDSGESDPDSTFLVSAGQELVVALDLDLFIEQEQRKAQAFAEQEEKSFLDFLKQEEEKFEAFSAEDRAKFAAYKNFQVRKLDIDETQDNKDEWVRWNKNLDQNVERK